MSDHEKRPRGLESVAPLKPAFTEANGVRNQPRVAFDPRNSFGSVTAGQQQFTLLADTDHTDPSIVRGVADNVAAMARSGVKHMIIEYPPNETTQKMIDQLYARPSQITYDEIRKNSGELNSGSPKTEAARNESGKAYAEMLINCHKNGIQLHMGGDHLGEEAALKIQQVAEKREALDRDAAQIDVIYKGYMKEGRSYLVKHGLAEKNGPSIVEDMLHKYQDGKKSLYDGLDKMQQSAFDEQTVQRMGATAEDTRAQRFIGMARGEKAVVMFGVDHINHGNDLNEALDRQLKAQALKNGTADNFASTKVIDLYGSQATHRQLRDIDMAGKGDVQYFQKEKLGALTAEGAQAFVQAQAAQIKSEPGLKK